jgi:hypothetical protein
MKRLLDAVIVLTVLLAMGGIASASIRLPDGGATSLLLVGSAGGLLGLRKLWRR